MHTMPLHDTKEFYHDLRGRANENLALSTALSVDNIFLQRVTFRQKAIYAWSTTCQAVVLYVWLKVASAMKDTIKDEYTHKDRHADHFWMTGMREGREGLRQKSKPMPARLSVTSPKT